ncbi:probable transcriptional regulator SLK2 isoform X2 [Gossypium raimondii]|uniref:probable transcriptional regulator SLK2 isoform X2 n=1 Tax=Gossypium raimondii TaxID=29730 RepID=UPI00227CF9D3|nr:probable transcriptional regulator SLK2 isoform X2 [Gossypium raimondii]
MNSPYENSSDSIPGTGCHNLGPVSGDMNCTVLNSVANSGPSVGASSLVTDANSVLSGGPHLQRSSSFNTDSYMCLPASPMSFSSNNMSGSSVIDGSSGGHQEPSVQHMQQSQQLQGASSATSLPTSQTGQVSLPTGPWVQGSFMQDSCNLSQVRKKPRVDVKQEDFFQQQMLQQLLQRQDSMQLLGRNPRLQDLYQQQRLGQRQQMLQSMPPLQRAHLQQQQIQLRQQFPQQGMQQVAGMKRPFDSGVCARRLMQYLYHQRQRPHDNTIAYWRKFVAEYYSTRAKKRWCLSMYNNVGSHALGVFPQAAMDAWYCDICGSKSGRGFEATFEVLPRLNEIKFSSGAIDELLFLDFPRECRFPSGMMMLEYGKAVQESVYEQLRVVREGQLRIIFTQDLKILSLEFCARRHEELYPRRLVAPQVNQLLQVAQKCHSSISEGGSDSVSQQDLQTNSNMFLMAGRQLVKSLELQSLNDFGFSKRYVRCLQIAEAVISMKDLIDFCREQKVGPIAKIQMQKMLEMEQLANVQGLPTEMNTLNKLMALHPGINNQTGNNHNIVGRGTLSSSAQTALALTNYQNLLVRQNSMNSKPSPLHQEASSSFNNFNRSPSSNFQGRAALLPSSMHTLPVSGLSSPHVLAQQPQLQRHTLTATNLIQQNHLLPSQSNQALQQKMIRQLLHEIPNNNTGVQQQSWSGQSENASMGRNGMGFGSNTTAAATSNMSGSVARAAPSQSNSYRAASNSDSTPAGGNNVSTQRAPDLPQNLHLQDDIMSDIAHELTENGFFNCDVDDHTNYGWKA